MQENQNIIELKFPEKAKENEVRIQNKYQLPPKGFRIKARPSVIHKA